MIEFRPYAWTIGEKLSYSIHQEGEEWANHAVAPPSEQPRGQLLRMVGGEAIRGAVERHFDVKLAFQNCHNLNCSSISLAQSPTNGRWENASSLPCSMARCPWNSTPRSTINPQTPHAQDELYFIHSGQGELVIADERHICTAGMVFFVPAVVKHRFEKFSADFSTWVICWGPAGDEGDNTP